MKKGIVIALAILMMFAIVGCGEKDFNTNENNSIAQQLIGTSWYQTLTTETDLGAGYLPENSNNRYDEITLKITTTVTYTFNSDTFSSNSEVITYIIGEKWAYDPYNPEYEETSTETESVNGTWHFENDRLYMIENGATTGVSYSVSIVNNELILENEYAGIFLRLKKK